MVWIALPAAMAAWISGGALDGGTAVPSLRSFARPGTPVVVGVVVVVVVVVLPGVPVPPVCAAAGTAAASTHASVSPASPRRRTTAGVSRFNTFSFEGLRG